MLTSSASQIFSQVPIAAVVTDSQMGRNQQNHKFLSRNEGKKLRREVSAQACWQSSISLCAPPDSGLASSPACARKLQSGPNPVKPQLFSFSHPSGEVL